MSFKVLYELRPDGRGIEPLGNNEGFVFPTVSSCMCVVVTTAGGGNMAGAHMTTLDSGRTAQIKAQLDALVPGGLYYIAGHLDYDEHQPNAFRPVATMQARGNVDILIASVGGILECRTRPANNGADLQSSLGYQRQTWIHTAGGCHIM